MATRNIDGSQVIPGSDLECILSSVNEATFKQQVSWLSSISSRFVKGVKDPHAIAKHTAQNVSKVALGSLIHGEWDKQVFFQTTLRFIEFERMMYQFTFEGLRALLNLLEYNEVEIPEFFWENFVQDTASLENPVALMVYLIFLKRMKDKASQTWQLYGVPQRMIDMIAQAKQEATGADLRFLTLILSRIEVAKIAAHSYEKCVHVATWFNFINDFTVNNRYEICLSKTPVLQEVMHHLFHNVLKIDTSVPGFNMIALVYQYQATLEKLDAQVKACRYFDFQAKLQSKILQLMQGEVAKVPPPPSSPFTPPKPNQIVTVTGDVWKSKTPPFLQHDRIHRWMVLDPKNAKDIEKVRSFQNWNKLYYADLSKHDLQIEMLFHGFSNLFEWLLTKPKYRSQFTWPTPRGLGALTLIFDTEGTLQHKGIIFLGIDAAQKPPILYHRYFEPVSKSDLIHQTFEQLSGRQIQEDEALTLTEKAFTWNENDLLVIDPDSHSATLTDHKHQVVLKILSVLK